MARKKLKEWLPGYKVVLIIPTGRLESFFCHYEYGKVSYAPECYTYPRTKCGPLAVFKTFEDALHFGGSGRLSAILPCAYIPSKRTQLWCPLDNPELFNSIKIMRRTFPRGTALAECVYILPGDTNSEEYDYDYTPR